VYLSLKGCDKTEKHKQTSFKTEQIIIGHDFKTDFHLSLK